LKKAFLKWSINIGLLGLLSSCSFSSVSMSQGMLNGRYNNEQVTLSANGKWLALVSDRSGTPRLMLYNLSEQRFVDLPFINTDEAVVESPSLSRTGRYLVYITSIDGKPDIILYDRLTQRQEILTQGYRSWVKRPKISADGRYVAFETSRRGHWNIEVLDRGPYVELDIPDGNPVNSPNR